MEVIVISSKGRSLIELFSINAHPRLRQRSGFPVHYAEQVGKVKGP